MTTRQRKIQKKRPRARSTPALIVLSIEGPMFYSQGDERVLFEWLKSVRCVRKISGAGTRMHILCDPSRVSERDLRELSAVFRRYALDLRPLRQFGRLPRVASQSQAKLALRRIRLVALRAGQTRSL